MIRFYNGRVLTFEPEAKISECEVWTDGGIISHFGPPDGTPSHCEEVKRRGNPLCI